MPKGPKGSARRW